MASLRAAVAVLALAAALAQLPAAALAAALAQLPAAALAARRYGARPDTATAAAAAESAQRLLGQKQRTLSQADIEAFFAESAAAANASLRESLELFTSVTHVAGTTKDKQQAEKTRELLLSYGLPEAEIIEYYPLLNRPGTRSLTMTKPVVFEASLLEDVVEEDPTSADQSAVPTFHGYGASGNVTGSLVYVNYGRIDDFEELRNRGVKLSGAIALVRYGQNFRGLKVRAAELAGCAGVIIYSDPADDGFVRGPVYPEGPWRPESAVQRGSVQYNALYAGDPLTPFVAAKSYNTERIPISEANIPKIPSLPISYRDAEPLLKAIKGRGIKAADIDPGWQGGLAFDYYVGGTSGIEINLQVENIFGISPIWDVVAYIPGSDPDEGEKTIILGNHRDAWTYGATDPSSGTAVMLETAKNLGSLYQLGWRPKRSILFASWDAEEYGLLGSVEFAEDYRDKLRKDAVVYVNIDVAVSGPNLGSNASPSLAAFIQEITKQVRDPSTGLSVYDRWLEQKGAKVGELGSGSDYTAFLQHLGISAIDMTFSGPQGIYHSNYDSFHWMEKFGDPTFEFHAAMAHIFSLMAYRLADMDVLPFSVVDYAVALKAYAKTLEAEAGGRLQFKELYSAIERFHEAAAVLDALKETATGAELVAVNKKLTYVERGFINSDGIPGRPWFRHVVFAPGIWAGYDSEVFPSVREALDGDRIQEAQKALNEIAKMISNLAIDSKI